MKSWFCTVMKVILASRFSFIYLQNKDSISKFIKMTSTTGIYYKNYSRKYLAENLFFESHFDSAFLFPHIFTYFSFLTFRQQHSEKENGKIVLKEYGKWQNSCHLPWDKKRILFFIQKWIEICSKFLRKFAGFPMKCCCLILYGNFREKSEWENWLYLNFLISFSNFSWDFRGILSRKKSCS